MIKPRVNVLYAPGINCHQETAEAFRMAGANPSFIHLTADILKGNKRLTDCDILALPGDSPLETMWPPVVLWASICYAT